MLHCFAVEIFYMAIIINTYIVGVITMQDFLFVEGKHNLSNYPDENSIDEVSQI